MSYLLLSPHDTTYSLESPFAHTDTEELYKRNLERFGSDWHWAKTPVNYKFNKYGYRMNKELEDVDFNNYYAFFGCSYTMGVGLPIEETYSYRIAEAAGVDYINGALGGAPVELVLYNIITLLTTAPNKPKVVVINWPELYRTMHWENSKLAFMLPNIKSDMMSRHWLKSYEAFITEDSHVVNRFKMIRNTVKLLCACMDIQLFEFTSYQVNDDFGKIFPDIRIFKIWFPEHDTPDKMHQNKARDISTTTSLAHPGLAHQELIVTEFFKVIK